MEKEYLLESMFALKKEMDKLQAEYDGFKKELVEKMQEEELTSFSMAGLGSVRCIAPTETKTVNLVALEEREPDLFNELMKDYPKVTKRAGYISVVWDRKANAGKAV